jgi:hypothetical protein
MFLRSSSAVFDICPVILSQKLAQAARQRSGAGLCVLALVEAKHRFGRFHEPGYDYGFARDHERSIGITADLLIAGSGETRSELLSGYTNSDAISP